MDDTCFTIGMAGHIDHGKTTLTKALTNVDTDHLKEEKERKISIESGYAPFEIKNGCHVSIIDVPGHERFIRQMIAGVAGIDMAVLVIAADEGMMPQTKEHLEILGFLGIERCIVAVSKIDRVDDELLDMVTEDIKEGLAGTIFAEAPLVCVDGVSGKGIDTLKQTISSELEQVGGRDAHGSFRLPIDQVFTVRGQGTIVRGTIYEGVVKKDSQLTILPKGYKVKSRRIQVHHQDKDEARAGQRTAINLGRMDREKIQRGDVLVTSDHFLVTNTIDVSLQFVDDLISSVKQRVPVKVHVGTSEVMGKIVFFDRNEVWRASEPVLCQVRLDEDIVVRRGDRFILRRPTPVETLGGGWVIEPKGGKYRFGEATIEMLRQRKEGTPEMIVTEVLMNHKLLDRKQLIQYTSLDEPALIATLRKGKEKGLLLQIGNKYGLKTHAKMMKEEIKQLLENYHDAYPMRPGISKAEIVQSFSKQYPKAFIQYMIDMLVASGDIAKDKQFLALSGFSSHLPKEWKVQMEAIINQLQLDGLTVRKWNDYVKNTSLSKKGAAELGNYLIHTKQAYVLTDDLLIHHTAFALALSTLKTKTEDTFELKEAKDALNVSRKYLVPFLELLDQYRLTLRVNDKRKWVK
ncbi:selenocysteine-specific translation elongation factor [Lentibacillus sp. N15]|uniref:selenocysteine-specific translation elongation factor n=1 Tax=Lentibacillus songyuanensis TaxID=3136161 RepID=UPI0031BB9DA6